MRNAIHRYLSWLLMLAMALAPMQGAMAMDAGEASMSPTCLQMMADDGGDLNDNLSVSDPTPCNQPSSPIPCPEMQGCSGFSGLNLFPSSSLSPSPRAALLVVRLLHSDARLTTRYPDLLQRPPQA